MLGNRVPVKNRFYSSKECMFTVIIMAPPLKPSVVFRGLLKVHHTIDVACSCAICSRQLS